MWKRQLIGKEFCWLASSCFDCIIKSLSMQVTFSLLLSFALQRASREKCKLIVSSASVYLIFSNYYFCPCLLQPSVPGIVLFPIYFISPPIFLFSLTLPVKSFHINYFIAAPYLVFVLSLYHLSLLSCLNKRVFHISFWSSALLQEGHQGPKKGNKAGKGSREQVLWGVTKGAGVYLA